MFDSKNFVLDIIAQGMKEDFSLLLSRSFEKNHRRLAESEIECHKLSLLCQPLVYLQADNKPDCGK